MTHIYKCNACNDYFNPPDDYDDSPSTRQCLLCGQVGFVAYIRNLASIPAVRQDGMNPTINPVNGKTYDSRSAYERAVKDAGCVIVGNDIPVKPSKPVTKDIDWKQAVADTLKKRPIK